ncbi:hypothetical protein [Rhizobium johnstonii]|uniref:hypothetical protein n=1 Tax=Rhizobium johnstonii TaxID=3019933 RepID=UPI003F95A92B
MQNPSQDFLALMKANISTKQRELDRLIDLVQRLKVELAEEERLYSQVAKYANTGESATAGFVARVSEEIESHPVGGQLSSEPEPATRKPRVTTHVYESDRIRVMAADVVREAGRIMSGPEILAGIRDKGYVFESTSPAELVKKALRTAPELMKAGRGYWLKGIDLPAPQPKASKTKTRSA